MTTTVIYLLHFEKPFRHVRHYMRSAGNLEQRLADHRNCPGARLMWWVHKAGFSRQLARAWSGGRQRERQLKQPGHARHCPICHPPRRPGACER